MEVIEDILRYVENQEISKSIDESFFAGIFHPMPTSIAHISK